MVNIQVGKRTRKSDDGRETQKSKRIRTQIEDFLKPAEENTLRR
jgi:hypothetical protein